MDEFIEKIKVLNLKKGDVLVVKYKDPLTHEIRVPNEVWKKSVEHHMKIIKDFITENWGGLVGMIIVPDSIDFEVVRLEEWFV